MGKVVLSGHGGFDTSTDPPWVTVPDGTTLYFYSDNMKALLDSNGQTVETMSAMLDSASPSQVVYSGSNAPTTRCTRRTGSTSWTRPTTSSR